VSSFVCHFGGRHPAHRCVAMATRRSQYTTHERLVTTKFASCSCINMLLCTRIHKGPNHSAVWCLNVTRCSWTGNRFRFEPININGYLKALLYIHTLKLTYFTRSLTYLNTASTLAVCSSRSCMVASAAAVPVIQSRLPTPAPTSRHNNIITVEFNCNNNNNNCYYANVSSNCECYLYRPNRQWHLNNTVSWKSTI